MTRFFRFPACTLLMACAAASSAVDEAPRQPPYQLLPVGQIKAQGWIRSQIARDLHQGYIGAFDRISKNVSQEMFVKQSVKPEGAQAGDGDLFKQTFWWLGEHEGYWKDGMIRCAFAIDDAALIQRASGWIHAIVAAKGADGYIGIYAPDARFLQVQGKEAELWTQSRIFQAMLAYYEATGEAPVLAAVEQAVQLTLSRYSTYFGRKGQPSSGGMSHGVGFGDTLENLYRLTGDRRYAVGVQWLYRDFSSAAPSEDMALPELLRVGDNWRGHAPHVMEAFPLPFYAAALSGDATLADAARDALEKLRRHTGPAGCVLAGVASQEAVGGMYATGSTYAEYCAQTEGLIAGNRALAYSGRLELGDWVELTALNFLQAGRLASGRGVAYLSRPNQRRIDEGIDTHGRRIFYSPSHVAAACCALNMHRVMPAYLEGMWLRSTADGGLLANLYGPAVLVTTVAGHPVRIESRTSFPFADTVVFRITSDQPVAFPIRFRVPEWAQDVTVKADGASIARSAGQVLATKAWATGDVVTLSFACTVQRRYAQDDQVYYQRGPLVYALRFAEELTPVKRTIGIDGQDAGFPEYQATTGDDSGWELRAKPTAGKKPASDGFVLERRGGGDPENPWADPPLALHGELVTVGGAPSPVDLVPIGCTVLRRTTFPAGAGEKE